MMEQFLSEDGEISFAWLYSTRAGWTSVRDALIENSLIEKEVGLGDLQNTIQPLNC